MSILLEHLQQELERIKPATILIVEPDKAIAGMLCDHLSNYTTIVFANGRDALSFCRETPPSLILIDSSLPDIAALDLFQHLLPIKFVNNIPVFIIGQRYDTRDQRMKALEMGVDDYIHKPFDVIELLLRIKNALPNPNHAADLVTGLPGWIAAHRELQKQLKQSGQQMILLQIENTDAYRDLNGTIAEQHVRRTIAEMLNDVVDELGAIEDFIGIIGESEFLIITHTAKAPEMIKSVNQKFQANLSQWYNQQELANGSIQLPNGRRAPLIAPKTAVIQNQTQSFNNPLEVIASLEKLLQKDVASSAPSEQQSPPLKAIFATS